jgi:hypothetical protein
MKKVLIAFFLSITLALAYYINCALFSSLNVVVGNNLQIEKVKIQGGFWNGNRKNDKELFSPTYKESYPIFENNSEKLFWGTGYGENDFLVTYNKQYYYVFRHFSFSNRDQNHNTINLSKVNQYILLNVTIVGYDGFKDKSFTDTMNLISNADKLRWNKPF